MPTMAFIIGFIGILVIIYSVAVIAWLDRQTDNLHRAHRNLSKRRTVIRAGDEAEQIIGDGAWTNRQ